MSDNQSDDTKLFRWWSPSHKTTQPSRRVGKNFQAYQRFQQIALSSKLITATDALAQQNAAMTSAQYASLSAQIQQHIQQQQMQHYQAMMLGQITGWPPNADTSHLPTQDTLGEIVAWRAWGFSNGYLTSPWQHTLWHAQQEVEAESPFECSAGVFAHKTKEQAIDQEGHNYAVIGTVLLWGDVVEHESGYRAQFARVGKLHHFRDTYSDSFKKWLASEYDTTP